MLRDELTVLLTQRTDHLTDHPGQISFPGGRAEPERRRRRRPPRCARRTRRSASSRSRSRCSASLPTYTTGTGFIVTPVVGLVQPGVALRPDPFEVAEVFEVPLAWLMNPANHQRHAVEVAGATREFLSMPVAGRRCRRHAAALLHLGRDGGDAAQPLPLPRRLIERVAADAAPARGPPL